MPRSKTKIYYNIKESDYMQNVGELTFYFSKTFYLEKFNEQLHDNRNEICKRLEYLYGVKIDCNEWLDIVLYLNIEKKGFRVFKRGEPLCQNNLILNGEIKTLPN